MDRLLTAAILVAVPGTVRGAVAHPWASDVVWPGGAIARTDHTPWKTRMAHHATEFSVYVEHH
ncbi:hypothetical protein [Streptomyces sp. NPDC047009]|uniref:hypothetical protein n=1 Tax=unclassified Streptomyces TaxID=2593676 RepID=UPI0033EF18F3